MFRRRLADACPNLVGLKDGHGNVEFLTCLRETLGDRRVYHSGDRAFTSEAMRSFFVPYLAIRNQRRGYAVSIIKAGLLVVGRPVRFARPCSISLRTRRRC